MRTVCDVMKKHEFKVLGCTEASGVVMTLKESQTRILLHQNDANVIAFVLVAVQN